MQREDYAEAARLRDELNAIEDDPTDLGQIKSKLDAAIHAENFKVPLLTSQHHSRGIWPRPTAVSAASVMCHTGGSQAKGPL